MTISSSISTVSYSGNGSTTVFAYTFKVFENSDLQVILKDISTSAEETQTITTDYTVSGAGDDSGGNVTFVTAPASGKTVIIKRVLPFTQNTDYVENDAFPAKAHEDALDKLTMISQQIERDLIDRVTDAINANYTINTFTGNASTTSFTLTIDPGGENNTMVFVNGVYQQKTTYSVSGTTLTFASAPAASAAIEVVSGEAISPGFSATASAVEFTPSGDDAVGRSVQAKLREIVSVQDFGAVGDGVTDDSQAIQDAFDAHNNVTFPPGTYIAKNIDLSANRSVYLQQGAIVKLKSGSLTAEYLFRINGIDNIRFFGGKVDGNFAGMSGQKPEVIKIQGNNTKNIEIASVHFINPPDRCIGVTTTSGDTIENIHLHDCFFEQSTQGENAFAINNLGRPGTVKRIEVSNNVMNDVISGIRFWGVDEWSIVNNRITCTSTTANECIGFFEGASNAKIVGNTLITDRQDPFCVTTGTEATTNDIVISDNVMIGPGTTSTNNSDGIEIVIRPGITCERWVIQNNTITGKQHGISLGFDASSSGTSNYNSIVIDGNSVKSISRGIAVIDDGSTTTCNMSDLIISNNVVELTSNSDAANDRCIQVRDNGSNMTLKNVVVDGNIAKNGYWGIYTDAVDGGTNLLVTNNIARNNVYGFRLAAAATVKSFKSMGNLSVDNTTAAYQLVNFTPQNGCAQINDSDTDGLLAPLATTFAADDATPSVANSRICFTQANSGATAITQLDDGVAGQEVIICGRSATNATTIADSGNFKLSAAITLTTDTNIHLVTHDGTTWNEVSRSAN